MKPCHEKANFSQARGPCPSVDPSRVVTLSPAMIGRLSDTDLSTNVRDRQPLGRVAVGLPEQSRHFVGAPSFPHESLLDTVYRGTPISGGPVFGEQTTQVLWPAVEEGALVQRPRGDRLRVCERGRLSRASKRLAESVQVNLGLSLLVPADVRSDPSDEISRPLRSLGFHRGSSSSSERDCWRSYRRDTNHARWEVPLLTRCSEAYRM
jgi:hypothetical protein